MIGPQLFSNNASTSVLQFMNTTQTSVTVANPNIFPTPGNGTFFLATIAQFGAVEIVKVTAKVGNVLTIVRGQEGTGAGIWPPGATIEMRITAATLAAFQPFANVQTFGAVGNNIADDTIAIQAAVDFIRLRGGGIVYFPPGTYFITSSIQCLNMSNTIFAGAGMEATTIRCSAALNGSDSNLFNDVFNANNLTVPVGSYLKYLQWQDMTIDCTLQNASGVPGPATGGYNLCAIECQNVDFASAYRVKFIKAFGNGFVSGSIDPRNSAAVHHATVEDCVFQNCVTGILPQYGITGSVMQYGAMQGGSIRNNKFLNSGGPAIDVFNCFGTNISQNFFAGYSGTPITAGQSVNSIHSDFGLNACSITDNIFQGAGPIFLNGLMTPVFFNGNIPTPGPNNCIITGNMLFDTALSSTATPTVPSSGGSVVNSANMPIIALLTGGSNVVVKVNGVTQVLSGANKERFTANAGTTILITYTVAPTWSWFLAPNANAAHIQLFGGSNATTLGNTLQNIVDNNQCIDAPRDAILQVDGQFNQLTGNIITNPGYSSGAGSAFGALDSATGVSGTGTQNCTFQNNVITDNRATKTLVSNYYDSSVNCVNNNFLDSRVETGTAGTFSLTTSPTQFYARGLYGPGTPNLFLGTVTAPASSINLQNPFSYDALVYVSGGTGVTVNVAGTSTGLASGTFKLVHGGVMSFNYSTIPTLQFFREG